MSSPKRWSMGGVVDPDNNIITPKNGFTGQSIEKVFYNLFGDITSNDALNTAGDAIQADQLLLQYLLGEQNWDRTNPTSVAQRLQAMGMSRAAALQAAAGIQGSETQVSPFTAQGINSQPIWQGIGAATGAFNAGIGALVSLSELPYNNKVKQATYDLLSTQGTMLQEQKEGQRLAAAYYQDAANEDFDFTGKKASDLLKFLADAGRDVSSFKNNPYAFASLSNMMREEYGTQAASYSPTDAVTLAACHRATQSLLEKEETTRDYQNRHLMRMDDIEDAVQELRKAGDVFQARESMFKYEFDMKSFENMLDHVGRYNQLENARVWYDLKRMQSFNSLKLWDKESRAFANSYAFQSMHYLFAYNLEKDMARSYEAAADRDANGVPQGKEFNDYMDRLIEMNTLGEQGKFDNTMRFLSLGAGIAGGVGAAALAAAKFLKPLSSTLMGMERTAAAGGVLLDAAGIAIGGTGSRAVSNALGRAVGASMKFTVPLSLISTVLSFSGDTNTTSKQLIDRDKQAYLSGM